MLAAETRTETSSELGGVVEAPGLRERKKRATRRALHAAALRLVVEHGYDAVTIEDIATAADVSPRTFFNYFGSKEDVIVNPEPERYEDLARQLRERDPQEPPLEALHQVIHDFLADLVSNRAEWLLRLRLVRNIPALQPRLLATLADMERVLAEDVARRTGLNVDTDFYPALVAAASMAAMRVSIQRWRDDSPEDAARLLSYLEEAFTQLRNGLQPPA